jgi:hypothetical protein
METLLHRLAIDAGAEHRRDGEEPKRTYSIATPPPLGHETLDKLGPNLHPTTPAGKRPTVFTTS